MFSMTKRGNVKPTLTEEDILKSELSITSTVIDNVYGTSAYITDSDIEKVKAFVLKHEQWEFQKIYSMGLRLPKGDTTVDEGVRARKRNKE